MKSKEERRTLHKFKNKDSYGNSTKRKNRDIITRFDGNYYKTLNVDGKKYNIKLKKERE